MHRYLRAIGFSNVKKREELQKLIHEVVVTAISKNHTKEEASSKKKQKKYEGHKINDFTHFQKSVNKCKKFTRFYTHTQ